MDIIFLGTSGSMPTKIRNLPSVVIRRGAEIIMLDCGEGTQKQMLFSKIGYNKKMKILITHMHGDHVLGLPGLFQSMALLGRSRKIEIFGPEGLEDFIISIERTVRYSRPFDLEICEVSSGKVIEEREYEILAAEADHGILCFAYALKEKKKPGRFKSEIAETLGIPKGPLWKKLQLGNSIKINGKTIKPSDVLGRRRPGKTIVYATDTRPCESIIDLAENADVLIHDCTFENSHEEKAMEYGHSTAGQAANIAKKSHAKKLILIHVSAMYEDPGKLLVEASKIHNDAILAYDLMKIKV